MFPLAGNIKKIVSIECYHFSENVPAFGGRMLPSFLAESALFITVGFAKPAMN